MMDISSCVSAVGGEAEEVETVDTEAAATAGGGELEGTTTPGGG